MGCVFKRLPGAKFKSLNNDKDEQPKRIDEPIINEALCRKVT